MKHWLTLVLGLTALFGSQPHSPAAEPARKKVYLLPIRDDIMPPMVYVVRRGVKEAMAAKADVLVIDMDTNGGRVDVTEEIIEILNQFKGQSVSFVNRKAFSAGAFICFATQKIFMAPQSVIGAAAPILMSPGGAGVEQMPDTLEVKTVSAISALVRASAEKNGHNVEVIDAMVKKTKELKIDGKVLNEKGQILTLTNQEAEQQYGSPPKPLLSAGTVESIDALLEKLGYAGAERVQIQPTGAERLGTWLNAISPLLLIIGIVGLYIEIKTPGFGLPGIVSIAAFALYFVSGYIAGLSGLEWIVVFVLGAALVVFELFVHPETTLPGLIGLILMLVALVMAMVDQYPGGPTLPTLPQLRLPMRDFSIAILSSIVIAAIVARFLPKTPIYRLLVSQSVSGVTSVAAQEKVRAAQIGQVGVTISPLHPAGKAQFGDQIFDVISQGDMVARGQKVRIIGHSGTEAIVEVTG